MSWMTALRKAAFQRSGGHWLFYWTILYLLVAFYSIFVASVAEIEYIQMVWILVCSLPLWIPPLARFLNMRVLWK